MPILLTHLLPFKWCFFKSFYALRKCDILLNISLTKTKKKSQLTSWKLALCTSFLILTTLLIFFYYTPPRRSSLLLLVLYLPIKCSCREILILLSGQELHCFVDHFVGKKWTDNTKLSTLMSIIRPGCSRLPESEKNTSPLIEPFSKNPDQDVW